MRLTTRNAYTARLVMMVSPLRARRVAVYLTCGFLLTSLILMLSQSSSTSPDSVRVPDWDHAAWLKEVERGNKVQFQREPVDLVPEGEASKVSGVAGSVQSMGPLTDGQKATALERIKNGIAHTEARYRQTGSGSFEEQRASLNEAYVLVMYQAAYRAVNESKAWVFLEGSKDYDVAWLNVPRGWRKMSMSNVATAEGGQTIDLIIAVDPAVDSGVQSVLDQMDALDSGRAAMLALEFNSLPAKERELRIRQHLDAQARLGTGEKLDKLTRQNLQRALFDDVLQFDLSKLQVFPKTSGSR